MIAIQSSHVFFRAILQSLRKIFAIFHWKDLFYAHITIIQFDYNTINTMDTLDLLLLSLRYAPLGLLMLGAMLLLWIQIREIKKG